MGRLIKQRCGEKGCEQCDYFEVLLNRGYDWCHAFNRGFRNDFEINNATTKRCSRFKKAEWLKKLERGESID